MSDSAAGTGTGTGTHVSFGDTVQLAPSTVVDAADATRFSHDAEETEPLLTDALPPKNRGSIIYLDAAGTISVTIASLSLLNSVIGVGILALPEAFSFTGIVLGFAILLLCGICGAISLGVCGYVTATVGATTYPTMIARALSIPALARPASLVILTNCFGVSISYTMIAVSTIDDILTDWDVVSPSSREKIPLLSLRQWLCIGVTGLVLLPLCLLRSYRHLKWFSMIATASMIYLIGAMLYRLATAEAVPCTACPPLSIGHFSTGMFSTFAICLFAFQTQAIMPAVAAELTHPTLKRIALVSVSTVGGAFLLYGSSAILGYLTWSASVHSNVITNYGRDPVMLAAQIGILLSVLAGAPTNVWPCRDAVLSLFAPSLRFNVKWQSIVASTIVLLAGTVAFFTDDLGVVVQLIGAVCGGALVFVLPSLCMCGLTAPPGPFTRIAKSKYFPVFTMMCILYVGVTVFVVLNVTLWRRKIE